MSTVTINVTSAEETVNILVQDVLPGEGPVTIQVTELSPQPNVTVEVGDVSTTPGQSAYQLWIAQGNVGTEADFLASLQGANGDPATVAVGTVTTGDAGTSAAVVNSGTPSAAVLDFTIPRGADGVGGGGDNVLILLDTAVSNGGTTDFVDVPALDLVIPAGSAVDVTYRITLEGGFGDLSVYIYLKSGDMGLMTRNYGSSGPQPADLTINALIGNVSSGKSGVADLAFTLAGVAITESTIGVRFNTLNPGDVASVTNAALIGKRIAPNV